jgi:hypothetical protein
VNKTSNVGIWIAIAALLVNMPRLVILFLDVDGIDLGLAAEGWLLGVGGVAMGVSLSGGGAYIAHTIAQPKPRPAAATVALIACWVALLLFSVILLSPSLVLAVRSYDMAKVLVTERQQWLWSIIAVIAVEVLAAGAMVAHAVSGAESAPQAKRPGLLAKLANAATDAAVAKLAQASAQPPVVAQLAPQPTTETPQAQLTATGAQRHDELLRLLSGIEDPDAINKAELGRALGVSRTQVGKDMGKLIDAGRLSINGKIQVHQ